MCVTTGNFADHLTIFTSAGKCVRKPLISIPIKSRLSGGNKQISCSAKIVIIACCDPAEQVLMCSSNGLGKIVKVNTIRIVKTKTSTGVRVISLASKNNNALVSTMAMTGMQDDVMVLTDKDHVSRIHISSIRASGRLSRGVKLVDKCTGNILSMVDTQAI